MNALEKAIVICALVGQVLVIPVGLLEMNTTATSQQQSLFSYFFAAIFLLSLCMVVLVLRDLYKRSFTNPNAKLTWLLVLMLTGGIGFFFYVFRHAFKPRGAAVDA